MPEITSQNLNKLDACLSNGAWFIVKQNREQGRGFVISIEQLRGPSHLSLSEMHILDFLPAGSKWVQARHWRSYFCIPFRARDLVWVAVGSQLIIEHGARQAYPVFRAYLFPFNLRGGADKCLIENLTKLADNIDDGRKEFKPNEKARGIVMSDSRTIAEHSSIEAWIIRCAMVSYRLNNLILFRTLVMCEDEIRKVDYPDFSFLLLKGLRYLKMQNRARPYLRFIHSHLFPNNTDFLMTAIPHICDTFSPRIQRMIRFHEFCL